jgi:hypothetical protein
LSLDITLLLTSYIITQSIGQHVDRFHDIRILVETGETPAMKRCWSGQVDHDRPGYDDGGRGRRRGGSQLCDQGRHALAMMSLACAVLVESSSIDIPDIPSRHTGSVLEATDFRCAISHRFPAATPLCLTSQNPIEKGTLMSGGWILLGLAVFGVVVKAIGWCCARAQRVDLGFVSRRWISEQHF